MAYSDFLGNERPVARTGFNRWPIPPAALSIHLSICGGGSATAPARLADMFRTQMAGAIHRYLLTALTTAGILGSVLVNYIRECQHAHGVAKATRLGHVDDIVKSRCLVQVMG